MTAPVVAFSALRVPYVGCAATANVRGNTGMSGSVPVSIINIGVLWATLVVLAFEVGTPGETLSVTAAAALVVLPLLAVNVKLSVP